MNLRSKKQMLDSIDIKIKASHINFVNKNSVKYTVDAVKKGVSSWIVPYQKPHLIGHDKQSDPVGRITSAELITTDSLSEPQDYVQLTAKITDAAAIEKILDGRYNTVSVGSKSSKVLCSECDQNIIEDGLCAHKKGATTSKGKRIHWIIDQIDYVECSFVNEPADEYACIDQINIGKGYVPYKDFLDNRETLISELLMEDAAMKDSVLSTAQRQKLPDSAFCYVAGSGESKVRKFPAHDAAHIRNALARLPQAKLPESAKSKILACLKRKAKRFEVKVGTDFVSQETLDYINSIDSTLGLNDSWTAEETAAVDLLFSEDSDFDNITVEKKDETPAPAKVENQDSEKQDYEALLASYKKLQEDSRLAVDTKETQIAQLDAKIKELETILIEREDEVNRYLDQVALLEQKIKDSVIENIIDLKKPDNKDERDSLKTKLESRSLESLNDSLSDLRITETKPAASSETEGRVKDPTQTTTDNTEESHEDEKNLDPWSIFSEDNRTVEVE